jgi:hypothetical protein
MEFLLTLPVFACLPSVAMQRMLLAKLGFPSLPTTGALYPNPYLGLGHAIVLLVPQLTGLGSCNPCPF